MRAEIEKLIEARIAYEKAKEALAVLRQAWDVVVEEKNAVAQVARLSLLEAEEKARAAGLVYYKEHPESKKLPYGLGIQSRSWMKYDPILALQWAKEHNIALVLDKSVFEATVEALASRGDPLPFVEMGKTDITTLPSKINMEEE
jgi:hypothetical protein